MTYAEKLKDPRWQKKRLHILELDEWTCRSCGSTTKTLNIHHALYRKFANPWDYPDWDLITLCEDCHEKHEAIKGDVARAMCSANPAAVQVFCLELSKLEAGLSTEVLQSVANDLAKVRAKKKIHE